MSRRVSYLTRVVNLEPAQAAARHFGHTAVQQGRSIRVAWPRGSAFFGADGTCTYDTDWLSRGEIDKFQQRYVIEEAKQAAQAQGLQCQEVLGEDGVVDLEIYVYD